MSRLLTRKPNTTKLSKWLNIVWALGVIRLTRPDPDPDPDPGQKETLNLIFVHTSL